MKLRSLGSSCVLLACACVPVLDGGDPGDTRHGFEVAAQGDGSFVGVVDARDESAFTYIDLESRTAVDGADEAWDLGFLRFNVATHAEVAVLAGADFDALVSAPADGYIVDASDPETAMQETMPGYAFDLWYDYDPATHVLTARPDLVYVVRTPEDGYFKVQILDYYDDAGTAGYLALRWAPLGPPA